MPFGTVQRDGRTSVRPGICVARWLGFRADWQRSGVMPTGNATRGFPHPGLGFCLDESAVIYCRVSTEEQATKGLSLRAQEETCAAVADRNGWTVSATCRDAGVSAGLALDRRPGLVQAIAQLTLGSVLLIAKRDRIFRADPFECAVIERAIRSRGGRIVSCAGEGTEDDSPSSIMMRRLLDAFAEYERLQVSVRTRAIMASKRARGERTGRIPFGQRLAADGRLLEPDQAELHALEAMRSLRAGGMSLRQIAAEMDGRTPPRGGGKWSHSSIRELLRRCENRPV